MASNKLTAAEIVRDYAQNKLLSINRKNQKYEKALREIEAFFVDLPNDLIEVRVCPKPSDLSIDVSLKVREQEIIITYFGGTFEVSTGFAWDDRFDTISSAFSRAFGAFTPVSDNEVDFFKKCLQTKDICI